jgi:hypothetical protein
MMKSAAATGGPSHLSEFDQNLTFSTNKKTNAAATVPLTASSAVGALTHGVAALKGQT